MCVQETNLVVPWLLFGLCIGALGMFAWLLWLGRNEGRSEQPTTEGRNS